MIQDLQALNEAVIPIYSIVANPYTFLFQVPHEAKWLTVPDLKRYIFYIPLHLC